VVITSDDATVTVNDIVRASSILSRRRARRPKTCSCSNFVARDEQEFQSWVTERQANEPSPAEYDEDVG
jgi:hypothetical protein